MEKKQNVQRVSLLAGRNTYYFRVICEASILQYVKRAKNAALFIKIQLHNWQLLTLTSAGWMVFAINTKLHSQELKVRQWGSCSFAKESN